ncbi:MAG: sporulation initiation factor Spo0A C-terminal domain-containing protein [Oscillospiraceae bacterium]|nr:sporulation initiation factor Spo0A C-terminal domain-containing protein [Oscillospiraceae bacterium]MBR2889694.1 sporulation initiation factor Spo0A C-terminal domain-containing protein [Oscillospiraceae bacterium]
MSELELTVEALKLCIQPEILEQALSRVKSASADQGNANSMDDQTLERVIGLHLLNAGMPTHIKGYRFTITAIRLLLQEPDMADGITKWLYPEVARIHDSTPSRVERAIRHGIEVAWSRGDLAIHYDYFRNTVDGARGKPTNSEFLTRMAYLTRERPAA